MNKCLRAMQQGNVQYKTLGLKKMKAEHDYRIALQKEIARLKIEGAKVTLIPDLARGNEEVARLTRQHNNVNMVAYGAKFITEEQGLKWVDIFLNTEFEGGRHINRVNKIEK